MLYIVGGTTCNDQIYCILPMLMLIISAYVASTGHPFIPGRAVIEAVLHFLSFSLIDCTTQLRV